ncbi:FAD:protein FMN transferase [Mesorhizobium atlanticum]
MIAPLRRSLSTTKPFPRPAATRLDLDASGRFNHIFDPATGSCANRYLSVSVVAPTAACADALSTGLSILPLERASSILADAGATRAYFVLPDGRVVDRSS